MRILYGVVGEGMGHAIRSRVILEHLANEGHEVEVMASGRAVAYLRSAFDNVHAIHGLHIVSKDNRVQRSETLLSNIKSGHTGIPKNIAAYFELIKRFSPEVVISDFESWTHSFGRLHRLPIISVDNMQIIPRAEHTDAILEGERANFEIARRLVKGKLPFCQHYLITSFFEPPLRKGKTSIHAPILREEILAAKPRVRRGEHLLVYQTSESNEKLQQVLEALDIECRVYGMRRELKEEAVEGKLRYRPFSEEGFVDDLVSCRAVVASAGFTLMGEAVYLHKPMLAVPLRDQFEQTINARYLEQQGFGMEAAQLDDVAVVRSFMDRLDEFEAALADYAQDGNRGLLSALDHQLDRAAAGV